MRVIIAAMASLMMLTIAACRGSETPIPRRTAYPRPALLDTVMTAAPDLPLYFPVNAQAKISSPGKGWLDVVYPSYGATLHVSFTQVSPSTLEEVKHNRMERLMLNCGDLTTENSEFTNPAGYSILATYTEGANTPLQFVATDNISIVVSGAIYLSDPNAPAAVDSIAPIIDALQGDLIRSLMRLSPHNNEHKSH